MLVLVILFHFASFGHFGCFQWVVSFRWFHSVASVLVHALVLAFTSQIDYVLLFDTSQGVTGVS